MASEFDARYSDTLTVHAIAKTMASSLCAGSVFNTYDKLDPADQKNAMDAYNPVLPSKNITYFVAVRNTHTDEQFMHPDAMDNLSDWFVHFREHSIFSIIDHELNFPVPKLKQPTFGSNAWEHTRFRHTTKNGVTTEWDIIVTLGILDDKRRTPNGDGDIVDMCIISPPIPNGADAYMSICTTSFAKYEATVRLACIEQANLVLNFGRSDDVESTAHDIKNPTSDAARRAAIIDGSHSPSNNEVQTSLYASFASYKREASAGSCVIPLILKHASFILPCIQTGDCKYTVLQPHKFGYIVQIEDVAGWRILASVNMTVSAAAIIRVLNNNRTLTAVGRRDQTLDLNQAIREESAEGTKKRMLAMTQLKVAIQAKVVYLARLLHRDVQDVLADLAALDVTTHATTVDALKLHKDIWTRHMAFVGACVLEQKLSVLNVRTAMEEDMKRGDAFIALYQNPKDDPALAARTLFDVCVGAAKVLLESKFIQQGDHDKFYSQILRHESKGTDEGTLDIQKIQNFMLRNCKGTAPETWFRSAHASFVRHPMDMVCALLNNPAAFAPLLPNDTASLSEYISNSAFVLDQYLAMINKLYADTEYADPIKPLEDNCFALALFIYKTAAGGGIETVKNKKTKFTFDLEMASHKVRLDALINDKAEHVAILAKKAPQFDQGTTQQMERNFDAFDLIEKICQETMLHFAQNFIDYDAAFHADNDTSKRKMLSTKLEKDTAILNQKIEGYFEQMDKYNKRAETLLRDHGGDNASFKARATLLIDAGKQKLILNKALSDGEEKAKNALELSLPENKNHLKFFRAELADLIIKLRNAEAKHLAAPTDPGAKATLDRYTKIKSEKEAQVETAKNTLAKIILDIAQHKSVVVRIGTANAEIQRRIDFNQQVVDGGTHSSPVPCVFNGEYGDSKTGTSGFDDVGGIADVLSNADEAYNKALLDRHALKDNIAAIKGADVVDNDALQFAEKKLYLVEEVIKDFKKVSQYLKSLSASKTALADGAPEEEEKENELF
jgi:hypothetical protein